jgi:hypothetical protein
MVDSIAVLPPGWRAMDDNGDPFPDAVLSFFNAGTTDTRTVYSDSNLSTSLGVAVACDSGGTPVTSGNAPTLIYTGSTAYKIVISSAIAGYSLTYDNVLGALDTSSFLTSAAVADQEIVPVSGNRAVTAADKGKLLNVNCTAGSITLTFDDAATLGSGFHVGIRHAGTANQVKIAGDGADTFALPGVAPTQFSLTGLGQSLWITCDGTNFKTHSETPPLISGNNGVIVIADRLSTPPGAPNGGQRFIVGASPTGAWSSFAQHDIAEADGFGTWFKYTPAASCGWIAYVQDEAEFYAFRGADWFSMGAASSVNGLVIRNNAATPTTQIDVTCAEARIGAVRAGAVSVTINGAATGANALDTGTLANNTWYYVHLINDGTTTAALLSLSATSPTMPAGYIYSYRIGAVRTGGSATFLRTIQRGNAAQYEVITSSTTPNLRIAATGAAGSTTVPTWAAIALATFIPTNVATHVSAVVAAPNNGAAVMVAPNNDYGAYNSTTNPPPVVIGASSGVDARCVSFTLVLEEANIYWATPGAAGHFIAILGWADAVNAS